MPNRTNPIATYLFALSAMIVVWTVYAKLAVPFLEGPPNVLRRQQVAIDQLDDSNILDKSHLPSLIPANEWELGACKTLLTPQGTVYFKTWEPIDDQGTYQLMPFTIVINDPVNKIRSIEPELKPGEKTPTPIVLRSLKGARLKFSQPLTARSDEGDIEMESAQLDGQVTVYRPANPGSDEDELRVVTRNVQINRSHIFTLADVLFSFGPHHGSGRNLSIQLAHKQDAQSPTESFSNIEGVEQMELAFVSELVIQPVDAHAFPDGTTKPDTNPDTNPTQALSLSNQKTPLRLSCDGPFIFRMGEQKAWFRENVVVTQLDDFRDNLRCDSLQIDFEKDKSQSTSVKNLIAIGTPTNPARIIANSQQTVITGEELNFDVQESKVRAVGSAPVSIQSPEMAFEAPNFDYQLGQNGKIGLLVAAGPGILKGVSEDREGSFEVKWKRQLTTTNFDSDRVKIDVDGDAFVQFDLENQIAADHIDFLVWQIPAANSTPEKTNWQYLPSKLTTQNNVKIMTARLNGSAQEFIANWPAPTIGQPNTTRHSVSFRPAIAVETTRRVTAQRSRRQRDDFQSLPRIGAVGKVVKPRAMKFAGDKVVANLTGDMDNMRISDLTVEGSLLLESNTTDQRPFVISGDTMKLVPQAKELYRVTIEGNEDRPATFRTEGFDLIGSNLQLDQTANTIWVHGAGNLTIDTQNQSGFGQDTKLPSLENAKVDWVGGMVFDGSKIYFEGDIELFANRSANKDGQRSTIKTNSEALTIELTESIRFEKIANTNPNASPANGPEVHRMVFVNDVAQSQRAFKLASHKQDDFGKKRIIGIQNATIDATGKVIALQKLFVPMASVDVISGDVATSGPGQAVAYQYSNGKQSRFNGGSNNFPAQTSSSQPELTCVHIRFDGQLIANAERGTMEIDRNTRSAWAPVSKFDQTLDPDRPDQLPVGAALLKSDTLKFAQWTPRNSEPRQEMQAEGNITIRSQLFEAVADRLTYSDDTDMLVLEGNPPTQAKLSYRKSPKSKSDSLRATKVLYRLSDQWAKANDIRGVEANMPRK